MNTDRGKVIDVQELFLSLNPVPTRAWRSRLRAGAFFPTMSLELAYPSVSWTPEYTLTQSALNTWIAEEIRTIGIEYEGLYRGTFVQSRHDYGFTAAIYATNDPAGR